MVAAEQVLWHSLALTLCHSPNAQTKTEKCQLGFLHLHHFNCSWQSFSLKETEDNKAEEPENYAKQSKCKVHCSIVLKNRNELVLHAVSWALKSLAEFQPLRKQNPTLFLLKKIDSITNLEEYRPQAFSVSLVTM